MIPLMGIQKKLAKLRGKVLCLEQLVYRLVVSGDAGAIRTAVCAEPCIDKALTICFSCKSPKVGPESWTEGLKGYINELRTVTSTLLTQ